MVATAMMFEWVSGHHIPTDYLCGCIAQIILYLVMHNNMVEVMYFLACNTIKSEANYYARLLYYGTFIYTQYTELCMVIVLSEYIDLW